MRSPSTWGSSPTCQSTDRLVPTSDWTSRTTSRVRLSMLIGTGWIEVRPIREKARRLSTRVPANWADSTIVAR